MDNTAIETINGYMRIDWDKKQFIFNKSFFKRKSADELFNFDDLSSYFLIKTDSSIEKHHWIARGIVGGASFGRTGAFVGAATGGKIYGSVNHLSVHINFKNHPQYTITILDPQTKKDSATYKILSQAADEIITALDRIKAVNRETEELELSDDTTSASAADEIAKFKSLLDAGAITAEEFNAKKQQLLNL